MSRILYPIVTAPVLTAAQQPETVTESRWHRPFSEPVRWRGLIAAIVVTTTIFAPPVVPTPVPVPTVAQWGQPPSQPVLRRSLPAAELAGAFQSPYIAPVPETVTVDKWFAPFGLPRFPRGLATSEQLPLSFVKAAPFAETVTSDRWARPFSEPVRLRGLPTHEQAYLSYVRVPPVAETVTLDKWFEPFSLPRFRRRGLETSEYPAFAAAAPGEVLVYDPPSTLSALESILADQTQLVYAAELSAWSISNQATTTIYVASRWFATKPTDSLANTEFAGVLSTAVNFTRSIQQQNGFGGFIDGNGTLEFDNTDGAFDYLIGDYTIDGRPIVVKVFRLGDSYDTAQVIYKGTGGDWFVKGTVSIVLRDNAYKLNVPVQSNVYGGGGGSDGGADLLGKKKPLSFGFVNNITPPLVEPAFLTYQTHDGAINGINAVYDRAVALTFDADYANYAALKAATIAGGFYSTCLAQGFFRLGSTPSGTVTANAFGPTAAGDGAGPVIRYLLSLATSLVDPTDLYVAAFTLFETKQSSALGYQIGYWCGTDSDETVADVYANLANAAGGWVGFRRDGLLELAEFDAPTGTPVASYSRNDGVLIDVQREPLPSGMWPPPWRQRINYSKNFTVQTDVAAAAGTSRISQVAQEGRTVVASDTSIRTNYLFAQDPPPADTYYTNSVAAVAEVARRLALYGTKRSLYRVTLNWRGLARNLGEVVEVTWPRWDLTGGKSMTIVQGTDNTKDGTVELLCYG